MILTYEEEKTLEFFFIALTSICDTLFMSFTIRMIKNRMKKKKLKWKKCWLFWIWHKTQNKIETIMRNEHCTFVWMIAIECLYGYQRLNGWIDRWMQGQYVILSQIPIEILHFLSCIDFIISVYWQYEILHLCSNRFD